MFMDAESRRLYNAIVVVTVHDELDASSSVVFITVF